eukprot:GFUD01006947.1.p1 GENE.GFUD01006947.1~~GFUD01006947.1.p1  ORF type:complete len:301 (+),score=94.24 GFUD01006947.1:253-1155(+)
MSGSGWVRDQYQYSWLERIGINVIKVGSIPRHVAVIMDGNRRFAKQSGVATIQGHSKGFEKLAETLQWCRELGVKEVTVYAFSIENFKRDEKEVKALLDLAKEKFKVLISEEEKLKKHGVRVKIIGNISYLPEDMQDIVRKAEKITENNSESTLNVAFSYTSREEITHAVSEACKMVDKDDLKPADIDQDLLERLMYTNHSSEPDLLIRTSGETRLSDFLLWQASNSITYFTPVLWPEFSIWQLLVGVFLYQRHHSSLDKLRQAGGEKGGVSDCQMGQIEQDSAVAGVLGDWWLGGSKLE